LLCQASFWPAAIDNDGFDEKHRFEEQRECVVPFCPRHCALENAMLLLLPCVGIQTSRKVPWWSERLVRSA
jgi:hypothetical protein